MVMMVGKLLQLLKFLRSRLFMSSAGAAGLLLLIMPAALYGAERATVRDTIAVFSYRHSTIQFNALSQKTTQDVMDTFSRLGRFMPVDADKVQKAMDDMPDGSDEEALRKAAEKLGAELYAVVTVISAGKYIVGAITVHPVSDRYKQISLNISVRSMVMMNIPLKLMREVVLLHRDLPVQAEVLEKRDGRFVLAAGQWHGLAPGRYRTDRGEPVIIHNCDRYRSLATLPGQASPGSRITINAFPSVSGLMREINDRIDYNTNYKYSLSGKEGQGVDPEKKFTQGICVINPGANACIPGYGSFLSTSYMGFKQTTPSVPGIVFSSLLIVTHFLLPECMTKFKINFFPGVMDKDKTRDMNNLQIFLWSTLPLTATIAYLDQLAYQFKANEALPPFFMNRNETALVLSTLIPGGGMFYKGYRLPGWGFYISEMFLAGFCVYTKDVKKKVMWGGITLGTVKFIELVTAYFCKSSFDYFNLEQEGPVRQASISMGIEPSETGNPVYKLGMTFQY
jgi:hypothetical protein